MQRTGVAIETQGFTFVTSGRKRESLTVSSATISREFCGNNRVFLHRLSMTHRSPNRVNFWFKGNATLHLYQHFEPLRQTAGQYSFGGNANGPCSLIGECPSKGLRVCIKAPETDIRFRRWMEFAPTTCESLAAFHRDAFGLRK